ncbi:autotransporter-associated beta strand repeat-containing protein [Hoeflea sp. AS60]|uniref:autotransporter-associated beta strand repeat-containing protein n=1 Tax=Hoeflea sp. AS60 TaxID=3135780 RepID=UPI00317BF9F3
MRSNASGGDLVHGNGVFALGSAGGVVDTNGNSNNLSRIVSGAGALTKAGNGTLTLTGANTYAGGTKITGGTLVGSTVSIRGAVAVSSGATVEFKETGTKTLSNVVSGAGSLAKSGAGTLTLTGANSYAGGTKITAGTLIGSTSSISGAVAVSSGAAVEFNQTSDGTLSNVVSGTGSFTKSGTGMLTLTGANTYSGGTAVKAGRLVANTSSISGDITVQSGAALRFDQGVDAEYSGGLSGAGALEKHGAGVLTLTGTSGVTGRTTITEGRLVGSASSIRGIVSIDNGAFLEFKQAADATQSKTISGAGSLVKSGSGRLELTGENFYYGGTTITGGTLAGSTSSIRGAVAVSSGATVEFNETTNKTLGNVVSGDGSLAKSGFGTLTLTGANTYTGGTTVTRGTLVGSMSSIRGAVAVSSGATVEFNEATDATLSNVVSGAGSLAKSGAGTLTLSGTSSYTGGTTVKAGRMVANASSISGAIKIESGATMHFDQATDADYSGALSGSGALEKSGNGTLTLTGTSSSTGSTTVKAGRLVASTSSISGAIEVESGAIMRFVQATDADYSGAISGDGALEKSGAGVLTLTGAFSLTGKTSVYDGELIVSAESLGASASFDLSGGELKVSGGGDATISTLQMGTNDGKLNLIGGQLTVSNVVSGTKALMLTGAGTLNLDAAGSNIDGGVTVSKGKLVVGSSSSKKSASLAGDVTVTSGAALGGHGTITGTVTNAGKLTPGNSIGILTIAGNYSGTGTLEIEVDGDASGTPSADKLVVNGTVDVSGTNLDLVLTPTTDSSWAQTPTGPFTIIENDGADAIIGTFASVKDNLLFLDPSLNYAGGTGNDIALTLKRNDIDFASKAKTGNQASTASAIEALGFSNTIYSAVVATASSDADAQTTFDSLSGEINASLRSVLISDSRLARSAVISHQASADAASPFWGQAIGSWSRFGQDGNASAAKSSTGGFVFGVDNVYSDALTFGLLGGYTNTGMSVGALSSTAETDTLHAGIYMGGTSGAWTHKAGLLGAYNSAQIDRVAAVSGRFSQSLTSTQDILTAQAFVETGYAFNVNGAKFEPFAGLAHVHLQNGSFSETGGSTALSAAAQGNDVTFSWIGLRAETAVSLFGLDAKVNGSVAWQHASAQKASFAHGFAGGSAFTVNGASLARDMALIETGIGMNFAGGAALDLSYKGQLAKDMQSHGFNARLSLAF